jgi:hypothetical protein
MDNRSIHPADELDALLDGRTANVPEDLAPLLEAAQLLRVVMQAHELDATIAAAHLQPIVGINPAQAPARPPTRPRWPRHDAAPRSGLDGLAELFVRPSGPAGTRSWSSSRPVGRSGSRGRR